jgi:hypothetical protein
VSTSLMPTPGPPLREREGITRRGREVVAWVPSPGFEAEAEAVEEPACDRDAGSGLEEGPAVAGPSSAVVDLATMVVVVVVDDDDAVAVAAAVAGGRAVDAETRLGMRLGDIEQKDFVGGRGRVGERGGIEGGCWMGWASSPVWGVSALARASVSTVSSFQLNISIPHSAQARRTKNK